MIDNTTDRDIYEAVIKSRGREENIVINGRDDDVDDDAVIKPSPTCRDILQASAVITRYMDKLDDPLACKCF
jgi:hypothetical protein